MRFRAEDGGSLLRVWGGHYDGEIAWLKFGLSGPQLTVEIPSDWHEHRRWWIHFGLGFCRGAISFKWHGKVRADHGQCSGPRYGFQFYSDLLWIRYGKDRGTKDDPCITIHMPWAWEHVRHSFLNADGSVHHHAERGEYGVPGDTKESHPYRYKLRSGDIQDRAATINGEEREWRWRWFQRLPWPRKVSRSINVEFSDEVGERSGSWKGGTTGCGYDWKRGESLLSALRRMESERKF